MGESEPPKYACSVSFWMTSSSIKVPPKTHSNNDHQISKTNSLSWHLNEARSVDPCRTSLKHNLFIVPLGNNHVHQDLNNNNNTPTINAVQQLLPNPLILRLINVIRISKTYLHALSTFVRYIKVLHKLSIMKKWLPSV